MVIWGANSLWYKMKATDLNQFGGYHVFQYSSTQRKLTKNQYILQTEDTPKYFILIVKLFQSLQQKWSHLSQTF